MRISDWSSDVCSSGLLGKICSTETKLGVARLQAAIVEQRDLDGIVGIERLLQQGGDAGLRFRAILVAADTDRLAAERGDGGLSRLVQVLAGNRVGAAGQPGRGQQGVSNGVGGKRMEIKV